MKKVLLALSLCASGALFASDADYHWEITPTIGGMTHEGNMDWIRILCSACVLPKIYKIRLSIK